MTEPIGWFAASVLLATIGRQVYTQCARFGADRRPEQNHYP